MNKPFKHVSIKQKEELSTAKCPFCDYVNEIYTACPTENSVCPHYDGISLWKVHETEKPYMLGGDAVMTFRKRIYIAGQMRRVVYYNFPAFDDAKAYLQREGWKVVSPADIDRQKRGFDPFILPIDYDWSKEPMGWEFNDIIREDIDDNLLKCDAIYMLRGWEKSMGGAHMEFAAAVDNDLETLFESMVHESLLEEAARLTSVTRQAEYGHPAHDFARQAKMWTGILMDKLKDGVEISAKEVGLCMVAVKMSREMNKPKRDNIVDGMGYLNCVNMIKEYEG